MAGSVCFSGGCQWHVGFHAPFCTLDHCVREMEDPALRDEWFCKETREQREQGGYQYYAQMEPEVAIIKFRATLEWEEDMDVFWQAESWECFDVDNQQYYSWSDNDE